MKKISIHVYLQYTCIQLFYIKYFSENLRKIIIWIIFYQQLLKQYKHKKCTAKFRKTLLKYILQD